MIRILIVIVTSYTGPIDRTISVMQLDCNIYMEETFIRYNQDISVDSFVRDIMAFRITYEFNFLIIIFVAFRFVDAVKQP